jgi:hypothetical protein
MSEPAHIQIGEDSHDVGETDCIPCRIGYPRPHSCGGLMHGAFVADDRQNDHLGPGTLVETKCDRCGETRVVVEPDD